MNIWSCYRALDADWQGALHRFGSPEAVQRLLSRYADDDSLRQICLALERQDGAGAYRAAHTLKGTAGMLGLTKLMMLADEVCTEYQSGRKPSKRLLQELEQCQERVMAYIAVLPRTPAVLRPEEMRTLERCFSGLPEDIRVVEAETGRSIYGQGAPVEAPERLIWDAAWLGRSGRQGIVKVWHYATGYAVLCRERAGEIWSMVSHDIRTPLHVISGMAAAARECRADTARLRLCLDRIDLAGRHLKSLVSGVMNASGQVTLCLEEFSLPELLQRVVSLMQQESTARQQRLQLRLGELRHAWVRADRNRLTRILLNLVTNAIKYTGEGGRIDLCCSERENGCYVLGVQDSGAGMTDSFIHRAFEPYTRARNAQGEGQGLGLAIVRRLAEMMDGQAEVCRGPGGGTSVQVILPLQPVQTPVFPSLRGIRVLLAEDHPLCAQATAMMLEQAGAQVRVVYTAREALSCPDQFDCAVMDMHLQNEDGCQIGRILRQKQGIPVLVLSGDGSEAARRRAAEAGLQGLMVKPVHPAELADALRLLTAAKVQTG